MVFLSTLVLCTLLATTSFALPAEIKQTEALASRATCSTTLTADVGLVLSSLAKTS
jgi:hypothetical protein